MRLAETIARQARSPVGPFGRVVAWFMTRETSPENYIAVRLLAPLPKEARVLEVGCGHGRTLRQLARLVPEGQVVGVDGSATMLDIAWRYNAAAVRRGRLRLLRADSGRLPFPDGPSTESSRRTSSTSGETPLHTSRRSTGCFAGEAAWSFASDRGRTRSPPGGSRRACIPSTRSPRWNGSRAMPASVTWTSTSAGSVAASSPGRWPCQERGVKEGAAAGALRLR